MPPYRDIFKGILGAFKEEVQIIPRTKAAPDDKGRATWTEGEPITVQAVILPIQTPQDNAERSYKSGEPLALYVARDTSINPHDIVVYDGKRWAITTLHKTHLQVEAQITPLKEVMT